jgi:Na+-transporting methylmalonyl-CoA/oxaloacetate decarboxylase gamma subunit
MEELRVLGEENLGMAMVFSLVSALQESLSSLIVRRVERKRAEEDRKEKEAEEAAAARLKGTAVTPESFLSWRKKFLLERKRGKEKEEEERLRNLPPKEREEAKRSKSKLVSIVLSSTSSSSLLPFLLPVSVLFAIRP